MTEAGSLFYKPTAAVCLQYNLTMLLSDLQGGQSYPLRTYFMLDVYFWKNKCSVFCHAFGFAALAPQADCQDMICSAHEFCGVDSSSRQPRCHCRALYASKYKSTNSFGK